MDPFAITRSLCGLDLPWRGNSRRGSRTSRARQDNDASAAHGRACRPIKWALIRSTAAGAMLTLRADELPLLRRQRPVRARSRSQLIELAGVIGRPVGRYDLDVPAAVRYQFCGFLQRGWNRRPVKGHVSRRILRSNQKPHLTASGREPPAILAWRAAASRAEAELPLPHHL